MRKCRGHRVRCLDENLLALSLPRPTIPLLDGFSKSAVPEVFVACLVFPQASQAQGLSGGPAKQSGLFSPTEACAHLCS